MSSDLLKYRYLSRRLPTPPTRRVAVLTGARQTGKTTMSKAIYPSLRYINLGAPENRETLRQLSTFIEAQDLTQTVDILTNDKVDRRCGGFHTKPPARHNRLYLHIFCFATKCAELFSAICRKSKLVLATNYVTQRAQLYP